MQIFSYSQARQSLAGVMTQASDNCEPVLITRSRGEDCVLMSLTQFRSLEETAYLLRSPANARRLLESIEQLQQGQGLVCELADVGE